jgi:polysaccharide export outer membrane protein
MLAHFFRFLVATAALAAMLSCSSTPSGPASPSGPVSTSLSTPVQPAFSARRNVDGSLERDLIPAVIGIPPDPGASGVHRIAAGDVLAVDVFQVDELSTEERVGDTGSIVMPLIGAIDLSGLTTEEAEGKIAAALAKDYLQDPQVNIFVKEYANMRITVGGAVKKPGVFPLTGTTTLLQAIAQAEGVTNLANEKEVIIFRTNAADAINAYVVDIKEIQQGQLRDPVLASNDKIVVPKSGSAVFFTNVRDSLRGFINFGALGL